MGVKGIKNEVLHGVVEKMNSELEKQVGKVDEAIASFNSSIVTALDEKQDLVNLLPFDMQLFLNRRESISKENYFAPILLNAGHIVDIHDLDSKVYRQREFVTKAPLFVPTGYNGVGFISNEKYKREVSRILETMALKTISAIPDGLFRVVIIDKDSAGQNFPNMMSFHPKITENKILSENKQIEKELDGLRNSSMRIVQNLQRNNFESIEDYNKTAGEVPQYYKIVMISNFPHGFDKKAAESLLALLDSPEGSGIYFFISFYMSGKFGMDESVFGISLSDFMKRMHVFSVNTSISPLMHRGLIKFRTTLEYSPYKAESSLKKLCGTTFEMSFEALSDEEMREIIKVCNERVEKMNLRPIIDITKTIPKSLWTSSATRGISVPFAKNGIEDVHFSLGINEFDEDNSTHHAIVCGSTGSGKTVLLHDIISHATMKYSPEELRIWLLDYKEGTEFAIYRDHPSVEILSMESEVEFGHEVLRKIVEDEIEKRGKLFKLVDARNLFEYERGRKRLIQEKREGKLPDDFPFDPEEKLPKLYRVLLIVDEFQELYPDNQFLKNETNKLLDALVRKGRSFGFNLILSTQTIRGVDMEDSIMSNIPLRVGLKMEERDAIKLFHESNEAPRFLKYPGEGIYNPQAGEPVANIPFQAYKSDESSLRQIKSIVYDKMRSRYSDDEIQKFMENRVVYVGNVPGVFNEDLMSELTENRKSGETKVFIGEPSGLKRDYAYITFPEDYASNLVVVGSDGTKTASLVKYFTEQTSFVEAENVIFVQNRQIDSVLEEIEKNGLANVFRGKAQLEKFNEIYEEMKRRESGSGQNKPLFLIGLYSESLPLFSSSSTQEQRAVMEKFREVMEHGPYVGIHIVFHTSSYSAFNMLGFGREIVFFSRKISYGGADDLRVFQSAGEKSLHFTYSKSPVVAFYINGNDDDSGVRKYKPFIYPKAPGAGKYFSD